MPGTGQATLCSQDALGQGSAIVGAFRTDSLHTSTCVDEEDLGVEAFDIDLLLVAGLQVDRGDAHKFVFLGHGSEW